MLNPVAVFGHSLPTQSTGLPTENCCLPCYPPVKDHRQGNITSYLSAAASFHKVHIFFQITFVPSTNAVILSIISEILSNIVWNIIVKYCISNKARVNCAKTGAYPIFSGLQLAYPVKKSWLFQPADDKSSLKGAWSGSHDQF